MISISFRRARADFLALAMAIAAAYPLNAQQVSTCYAKTTGTMYRIGVPNTPSTCTKASHTVETWGAKLDQNGVLILTNANGLVAGGTVGQGTIPASGPGPRMMWYPAKAAFRAGYSVDTRWDDANVGDFSFAANYNTQAGGKSAAFGFYSKAIGVSTFAAGEKSVATSLASVAMGIDDSSNSIASIALGQENRANGQQSVAIGYRTVADGDGSVTLGSYVAATIAAKGSFVFGDRSNSIDYITNSTPNSFLVRAVGGVTFVVAGNGANCSIPAGGGQWACSSSRLLKTGIADLDGEDILARIRALPVQSWSYTAEGSVRHIGPMAQDFRAAFGLGADDTTIGVFDAAGVSLAGVKALEARTTQLRAENAALRSALEELRANVAALQSARSPRP